MRILQIVDTLDFGGAEKVLVALANGLASDHEVSVCCISHSGALASELDTRVEVFAMGRGLGNDYGIPRRLADVMQRRGIEVVHTHNWGVFLEGGVAAALARIPVAVHTVHGPYQACAAGWLARLKRRMRHAAERRMAHRFRRIVAVSDSVAKYIPELIGIEASRVCTIHNGISEGAPRALKHSGESDSLTFVTVGRLDAIKNQAMMIRAFARVSRSLQRSRLVIVGDGPERSALERLVTDLDMADKVTFTGFRSDVDAALRDADVFLMSSRYEGISIAMLEAMRSGLPIVATAVGGVPEMVADERTGLLVPSEDEQAFTAAMCRVAGDARMRREMGESARTLQACEFSLPAMLSRYQSIYNEPVGAG
jgi:glycosyltransferase involved in cell wall biosynthesis